MFRDALSPEQQVQVAAVNRQVRRITAILAVFGAIGFFAIVSGQVWDLVRHRA